MPGSKIASCKCGARIVWLQTRDGKNMPANLETVPPGDCVFDRDRHVAHWATCPRADEHRRKPAGARPRPEPTAPPPGPLLEMLPAEPARHRFMTSDRIKAIDVELVRAQIARSDFKVIREAVGPRGDPWGWDEGQYNSAFALIASTAEARDHATARMKGEAS